MKKALKRTLCTLLSLTITMPACIQHHYKPTTHTTTKLEEITTFSYQPATIQLTSRETIETTKYFKHEKIKYPAAFHIDKQKDEVIAHYYTPTKTYSSETFPLIEVFPILGGGSQEISAVMSKYLAKRGFAVLSFERSGKLLRSEQPIDYSKDVIKRAIIDARRGLDWAQTQPEINPNQIGVAGTSMGSITAALTAMADPRIKTGGFLMAGGDLATLLTISKEKSVERYREEIMQKQNINIDEFFELTKEITKDIEPLNYAHQLNPANFIIINGVLDKVVPPKNANKLWKSMGKPDRIRVLSGHYTFFPYFFYANRKITDKFCDVFEIQKRNITEFW
ncbi:prolyl oligopeptidase family serine peptidase [Candidatus Woesearchaeota archaeon]|nr:prolyl oligopeptidase family serine peptidase [Candidatus Woesearchaeota archaeon]